MYSAFEGFDESDLVGTIASIKSEIDKLPQRYSDLWDIFKGSTGTGVVSFHNFSDYSRYFSD